jgi:hypothetical protein
MRKERVMPILSNLTAVAFRPLDKSDREQLK